MDKRTYPGGVQPSEITPESLYLSRRDWLKAVGLFGLGALLAACTPKGLRGPATPLGGGNTSGLTDELGDPATSYEAITHYNNYYEFSLDKGDVAKKAADFPTDPWTIEVTGLVHRPLRLGLEDIRKRFPQEDRVYRLRCVEGWSMVIPWQGFPLADLLQMAEPKAEARFVRFVSLHDPQRMPNQARLASMFPWPYTEGLRLDEAMHPLTLMATGLYGRPLPPQNGAPLRLVVPWKYGFKSAKAVVRIELVAEQPATFWHTVAPAEYGFYANVNPNVPHPRWSQASERRIGELGRRPTLLFNGYADQVAALYQGMDLREHY